MMTEPINKTKENSPIAMTMAAEPNTAPIEVNTGASLLTMILL